MKHKFLIFSIFFLLPIIASSQSLTLTPGVEGNVQFPSLDYEKILSISNPKEGMVVYDKTYHCLRYFNGQKWLSTFQNNGNSDPVVTAWIKPLTQYTLGDFRIFDFKMDKNENIYVLGDCNRTGETASYYFIVKLDKNLKLQWHNSFYAFGPFGSGRLNIDIDGNIYTIVTRFNYRLISSTSLEIKKININGSVQFEKNYESFKGGYMTLNNLYLDNSNSLYLSYNAEGNESICKLSNIDVSILWTKSFNPSYTWFKFLTSTMGETFVYGRLNGVYNIEGRFFGSDGESDIIIAKYDSNGNIKWINRYGGGGKADIKDLTLDSYGNFYALGAFNSDLIVNDRTLFSFGLEDIVLLKGDPNGTIQITKQIGSIGNDLAMSIALNSANKIIILGQSGGISLNYGNGIINTNSSPTNFLANLNIDGSVYSINAVSNTIQKNKIDSNDYIYSWDEFGYSKFSTDCTLLKKVNKSGGNFMLFGNNQDFYFSGIFTGELAIGNYTYNTSIPAVYVSHWTE